MGTTFDDIFNECIERMARGEPIESCLADYPDHAEELKPLLMTSQSALSLSSIEATREFKEAARSRVLKAVYEQGSSKGTMSWLPAMSRRFKAWATVAAALVLVIGFGAGTVQASSNSLPGDTLYSVKQTIEKVRLNLAFSDSAKARLHLRLAEKRVEEMNRLIVRGDVEHVASLSEKVARQLERAVSLHGIDTRSLTQQRFDELRSKFRGQAPGTDIQTRPDSELGSLRTRLELSFISNREKLQAGLEAVPAGDKELVQNAIQVYSSRYERVILAIKDAEQRRNNANSE